MKKISYGMHSISPADIESVINTLKSDFLTQGPAVAKFEEKFAKYVGSKYAVAVTNGTAALHLAVLALGLKPGKKVITSPISFVASSNSVLYVGGEIDFADIDSASGLIDINSLEERIKSGGPDSYSGIIAVDFAGNPVNLEKLRIVAKKYNLWIIEDACHSPGGFFTTSDSRRSLCGSCEFNDISIFSFHPVKHIATGEGGMLTTNSEELYEKLLVLRTHGITREKGKFLNSSEDIEMGPWYYEMQSLGYNYRMPDILASLGTSQLERADKNIERRHEIAKLYDEGFKNSEIVPLVKFNEGHAYHLYVIQSEKRTKIYNVLVENEIFPQIHYIPIHLQPYYKGLGFSEGDFPNAENYYKKALSLPMFPTLEDQDIQRIIEIVIGV
ncbi:UDP-4-amino-4,6-dideoxy-N-acetyl-beta-L-altrosamine transaminase [Leptospira bourretii]|uniref:UDP-4-amino-4, 6-dideoxy-N-acetyl-beta-L-altrosamine transaminase n=1 Tax=Leptospira bourretii TaxID=2484962 RepID=A0A4R9IKI3_9LEPT|nr:UDP-4-amino-4,6-dideoxy-N-acetyl-beta-L-altrosamine transaminase [Leptospira bourretii]TGK79415.1 UDP-4-amino-4,6-dideoxy-N-acetyl-beta-L-altrosamine transaminase [Leptospira bourretii]TGK89622.1 UDP-4-amino-4,6-dideoxy-N-acetyl-beta-L-altrosamine transaminase [Leptospira bourretii]TGL30563.1 UDP-4-amino-4,6-dideoxy-N-acetyl-beta-L-altrosamine transaminase [Leptospira bourretii]